MRRACVVLLALAACKKPTPGAHPNPQPAAEACRKALVDGRGLAPEAQVRYAFRHCADVRTFPSCRTAMRSAADTDWPEGLKQMQRACTAAYCPKLPEPRPALCATPDAIDHTQFSEFHMAMLRYDLGSVVVDLAEPYEALMAPVRPVTDRLVPAYRSPIPVLELRRVGETQTRIELQLPDGGAAVWVVRNDQDAFDFEAVRKGLAAADSRQLTVRSESEVLYRIVRRIQDTVADAGCTLVEFELIRDGGTP